MNPDLASITGTSAPPTCGFDQGSQGLTVRLAGAWVAEHAATMETLMADLAERARSLPQITIDLSGIARLDTAAAWLLDRTRHALLAEGRTVLLSGGTEEHRILIDEVDQYEVVPSREADENEVTEALETVGRNVVGIERDVVSGLSFLGEFVTAVGGLFLHPRRLRGTALVAQLDRVALHGVPIIALISFLVGGIIAQQGIFQLRKFGAATFVVDLVGILTLRELGVLLTAIMLAGRSGSSFTAELGSMKMREEIDAIRVMGLDPMEVLIIPRLLALVIALPMLTFISDISALFGGGLIAWLYDDMSPRVFMSRLQDAVELNTFMVGILKAPFMALIIGMIATVEGFAVAGSAESLGRHVTASVVKSIFMVIVADGLFAIFFAAIEY